ncbi:MAG: hypothetical protein LBS21_00600 [Clostridiales bacterium]|jgi:hypothetical protein|nr:hypothetical protein [Clostridiales bacterium]
MDFFITHVRLVVFVSFFLFFLAACTKEELNFSGATGSEMEYTQGSQDENKKIKDIQAAEGKNQEIVIEEQNIEIKSYDSDKAQAAGLDITLNGVRFPLPCTLADLGDKWSFDCGDMSEISSGSFNGIGHKFVGNFFTVNFTLEDGRPIYLTTIELCYENKVIGQVSFADIIPGEDNVEDAIITGFGFNYDDKNNDYWELKINGIELGDSLSGTKNSFSDWEFEERIRNEQKEYQFEKDIFEVSLHCDERDIKEYNLSTLTYPITALSLNIDY